MQVVMVCNQLWYSITAALQAVPYCLHRFLSNVSPIWYNTYSAYWFSRTACLLLHMLFSLWNTFYIGYIVKDEIITWMRFIFATGTSVWLGSVCTSEKKSKLFKNFLLTLFLKKGCVFQLALFFALWLECVSLYFLLQFNFGFVCLMQTLLKTTNHILIHDVRGSLAHLCSLVQRGVSPSVNMCVICSRPPSGLADGSKDDVMVFTWVWWL